MLPTQPAQWERHTYMTFPADSKEANLLYKAFISGEDIVDDKVITRVTEAQFSAYAPTIEKDPEMVFQLWQVMEDGILEENERLRKALGQLASNDCCHGCKKFANDALRTPDEQAEIDACLPSDRMREGWRHDSCSADNPCCDRRGEYNGFGSDGPMIFECPNSCMCHD